MKDPAAEFLAALQSAAEYCNPAIALAAELQRAELASDSGALDRAIRSGALERAVFEGRREGKDCQRALQALGHCPPQESTTVPIGF